MTRLLGAVLAGGRSIRFGSDKGVAILAGRTLIDLAVAMLEQHVDTVIMCGRTNGLPDRPQPDLGPLGGLNAALHFGRSQGFDAVFSIPCDTPSIPRGAIDLLMQAGAPACLARCPVVGLWRCADADTLDEHLGGADRSMRAWAERVGARFVAADTRVDNINTEEDLQRLARRVTLASGS